MSIHGAASTETASVSPTFFELYQLDLADMFDTLGMEKENAATLPQAVAATQPFTSGDHFRPGHGFALSDSQQLRLAKLYHDFGLTGTTPLEPGHYDEIAVLGGTQKGNNLRIGFVAETLESGGVTTDRVSLLGGQRPVFPEIETPQIAATLTEAWSLDTGDPWTDRLKTDQSALDNETQLLRLSAVVKLGRLSLRRINLRLENADPVESYEFEYPSGDGNIPVTLIHALAAVRPNGDQRHTTESCFAEWLRIREPEKGSRVAFISSNPHLMRMAQSARSVLRAAGREDITLVPGGPETTQTSNHALYLGEIARTLYEDQKLISVSA